MLVRTMRSLSLPFPYSYRCLSVCTASTKTPFDQRFPVAHDRHHNISDPHGPILFLISAFSFRPQVLPCVISSFSSIQRARPSLANISCSLSPSDRCSSPALASHTETVVRACSRLSVLLLSRPFSPSLCLPSPLGRHLLLFAATFPTLCSGTLSAMIL